MPADRGNSMWMSQQSNLTGQAFGAAAARSSRRESQRANNEMRVSGHDIYGAQGGHLTSLTVFLRTSLQSI
jgi:hypothetical protein